MLLLPPAQGELQVDEKIFLCIGTENYDSQHISSPILNSTKSCQAKFSTSDQVTENLLSLFNSTGITLEANANSLISGKLPGRVGDSPLVGQVTDTIIIQGDDKTLEVIVQGVFADDLSVAVSCTGTGETFMRAGVARRAAFMVRI